MKIRLFASPIVAAFFVLNCWAQNAPASTPPPNSFLDRLTSLTDSDWQTMDGRTVCNHGAHPRCGNDGPECIQHACAPHGQYRSEAQWFAAGSGRCRMGSCQDAGDGDERHAGKNDCSSLGTRKGRRSLNPVAGNAAGDNAEDRCHNIGKLCANVGGWSYCKCVGRRLLCRIEELARW